MCCERGGGGVDSSVSEVKYRAWTGLGVLAGRVAVSPVGTLRGSLARGLGKVSQVDG